MMSKEKVIEERKAMPTFGHGTFKWGGNILTLPIVKVGKKSLIMRADDCGLITLNKKFVEVKP